MNTTLQSSPESGYAIVGDLHGNVELLKRATDVINPQQVQFVVQDQLDKGPAIRETMLFSKEIGAIALADNHSWVSGNAITFDIHEDRFWLRSWYKHYEWGTLESFGITKRGNAERDALALREKLEQDGLLEDILETKPYVEPEDGDFIAIHAGVLPYSWDTQKRILDTQSKPGSRHLYPPQEIFDDDKFTHSSRQRCYPFSTNKIVVTGHSHLSLAKDERITDHGQRVRLASKLHQGEPLYIYLTASHEIVEIPQE